MMRKTFRSMNEDELRDLVRKLRKDKLRLRERLQKAQNSPDFFEAEGNNGGSFVRLEKVFEADYKTVKEGMVNLVVGETCVITVRQKISVVALAAILTHARDKGFQNLVNEYLGTAAAGGTPKISVEHDVTKETA